MPRKKKPVVEEPPETFDNKTNSFADKEGTFAGNQAEAPALETTEPISGSIPEGEIAVVDVLEPEDAEDEKTQREQQAEEKSAEHERAAAIAMIAGLVEVGANVLITRWPPAPPLRPDESAQLAERIYALSEYYGITMSEPWSLWVGLGLTGLMVFGPRYAVHMEYVEQQRAKPRPETARDNQAGDRPEEIREDEQTESSYS